MFEYKNVILSVDTMCKRGSNVATEVDCFIDKENQSNSRLIKVKVKVDEERKQVISNYMVTIQRPNREKNLRLTSITDIDLMRNLEEAVNNYYPNVSLSLLIRGATYRSVLFLFEIGYASITVRDARLNQFENLLAKIYTDRIEYFHYMDEELLTAILKRSESSLIDFVNTVVFPKNSKLPFGEIKNLDFAVSEGIRYSCNDKVSNSQIEKVLTLYKTAIENLRKHLVLPNISFPFVQITNKNMDGGGFNGTYNKITNKMEIDYGVNINVYYHELTHFLEPFYYATDTIRKELTDFLKAERGEIEYIKKAKENSSKSYYYYLYKPTEVFARYIESYFTYLYHRPIYLIEKDKSMNNYLELERFEAKMIELGLMEKSYLNLTVDEVEGE